MRKRFTQRDVFVKQELPIAYSSVFSENYSKYSLTSIRGIPKASEIEAVSEQLQSNDGINDDNKEDQQ